jgi:hypothetical protein
MRISKRCSILPVLLVLSLAFITTGQAALEVYEEAHELKSEQITHWPLRAGDNLIFRPCVNCAVKTLKVTDQTRYSSGFDSASISLSEVLRQKSLLRKDTEHVVVVFFLPEELQVTRLILQTEF